MVAASVNGVCGASRVGGLCGALLPLVLACAPWAPPADGYRVHTVPVEREAERHCAWFGDADERTLYFGVSAFWWAGRRAGPPFDPEADLERDGPVWVGRFDLQEQRLREPLRVAETGASGIWDVLAHPNGRVYFSNYFGTSGWLEPATGRVRLLPELGPGLNEITAVGDGELAISRYPTPDRPGSLLWIDPEGRLLDEVLLPAPPGYQAAPKTVAVDPRRGHVWIAMDLLPDGAALDAPTRHDAYVLDADGELIRAIDHTEIQFPAFAADGTGYFAEADRGALWLRIVPPDAEPLDPEAGRRVLLDPDYPEELDFAQELRPLPGGGALVTRWSGRVHQVDGDGSTRMLRLPELEPGGLYYTAVLHDGRVCATYCADVNVVCTDAP